MAVIDPRDDSIVIRIVYDGAPMAGKTTSVGALGRGLGAMVHSPAALEGRTLFFDWLDYTGGLFEGRRIRCQIVSVPGQATLAPRRRRLLEAADVVVFVGDSSPQGFDADSRYLASLNHLLATRSGPPVGIVLQANKRDLPDAIPIQQLQQLLERMGLRLGIVESTATEGSGIRETFVFAVRLALDRVRELMRTNELPTMPPQIDSADQLLGDLQASEDGALDMAVADGLRHIRLQDLSEHSTAAAQPATAAEAQPSETPAAAEESMAQSAFREAMREEAAAPEPAPTVQRNLDASPAPPDSRIGSGLIWPPVDGRVLLHSTAQQPPKLERLACGSWSGLAGEQWRFYSEHDAIFPNLETGRDALVSWARVHSAGQHALSKDRCIALTAEDNRHFRLWQIVGVHETLHDRLVDSLQGTADALADTILLITRLFMEMAERLNEGPCALPLSLDTILAGDAGPSFVGLLPTPANVTSAAHRSGEEVCDALIAELSIARATLHQRRTEVLPALAKRVRESGTRNQDEWPVLQRIVQLTHAA